MDPYSVYQADVDSSDVYPLLGLDSSDGYPTDVNTPDAGFLNVETADVACMGFTLILIHTRLQL